MSFLRPFAFLGLAALALVWVPVGPARADDETAGWIDLLAKAGPDLKGWTRLSLPPGRTLDGTKSQWSYDPKTKTLTCKGDGGHEWLRWDEPIDDCVYHVEWRFVPTIAKARYNAGVYVRNSADGKVWHQAQTGDGSGGYLFADTVVDGQPKRVNLSKTFDTKQVKRAGEWNTFEITCRGKSIALVVNGVKTGVWDACEVPKGHVGLEAEGYEIEFRNVKLKPLK